MSGQRNTVMEDTLRNALCGCEFVTAVCVFDLVSSTNDEARLLAEKGAPEGTVVLAAAQSRGRGRQGRGWISPAGKGVYFSCLLRPGWPADQAGWLAVVAGVAAARAIKRFVPEGVSIKWPNDILVRGKKIAGILVEPTLARGRIDTAVIGVGINNTHEEADWAESPAEGRATSLMLEGARVAVPDIAAAVTEELARIYVDGPAPGSAGLLEDWVAFGGRKVMPVI
jgi:BirA family biotin operon repressor/biotin-[acetyl-CoA-carboxylase] ligase